MTNIREEIVKVEVLDTKRLQLVLGSGGNASYQYIYRSGRGVNWDSEVGAFIGTEQIKWSFAEWFKNIVAACADELGVTLFLSRTVEWVNVPVKDEQEILATYSA